MSNQPEESVVAKPLLSICIPTYNRAAWLRASLAFSAPQVKAAGGLVELIVSDNCSPDETAQVVEEAQALGPIRYHRNETNIGANPNMYRLVSELARGEYVWVLGDDDFIRDGGVAAIVDVLRHYTDLGFVYLNYLAWTVTGPPEGVVPPSTFELLDITGSPIRNNFHVDRVAQIVEYDGNCFTNVYAFILPRRESVAAFQKSTHERPFTSLDSVVSHAVYIADHLLDRSGWYMGYPYVVTSNDTTWHEDYLPVYQLVLRPQLYNRFEKNGVPRPVIDLHRRSMLCGAQELGIFRRMIRDSCTPLRDRFSLFKFIYQHWRFPELWWLLWSVYGSLKNDQQTAGLLSGRELMMRVLWSFRPTAVIMHHTRRLLRLDKCVTDR